MTFGKDSVLPLYEGEELPTRVCRLGRPLPRSRLREAEESMVIDGGAL